MKMPRIFLLACLGFMAAALPAQAQWRATTSCPGATALQPAGSSGAIALVDVNGNLCISGTVGVTFPTIGAPVPATGVYNGINVAGTLRGLSGLSTGSLFPAATAIVDASGNQITTFGGAATTSNASSGVATSAANQATVSWNYVWNGAAWDQASGLIVGTLGAPSTQYISVQNADPCFGQVKSSAPINVTSATTTSLVPVSGTTIVYICGFSITVAPSAVTAATALFEYGTGAACTGPVVLTGTFGNGDLTSTVGVAPIVFGSGGATIFKSAASNGVCILTAGNAVNVQGVMSYVQQ